MKTFLFILFFPITVPVYLFSKFTIWFFEAFSNLLGNFFGNHIIPGSKKYFAHKSAERREKAFNDNNESNIHKDCNTENQIQNSNHKDIAKSKNFSAHFSNNHTEPTLSFIKEDDDYSNEVASQETLDYVQQLLIKQGKNKNIEIETNDATPIIRLSEYTVGSTDEQITEFSKFESFAAPQDIEVTPETDEEVFHLFYSLGCAKRCLRDCTTPEKFFNNLDIAHDNLKELTIIENNKEYPFYSPLPSEQLAEFENCDNYIDIINKFIYRYWHKILKEASALKKSENKLAKIKSFSNGILPYYSYLTEENKNYLRELETAKLNLNNLPRLEKEKRIFDEAKERTLLCALENAYTAFLL